MQLEQLEKNLGQMFSSSSGQLSGRKSIFEKAIQIGFPTKKDEAWKYSPLSVIRDTEFSPLVPSRADMKSIERLALSPGVRIVFNGGKLDDSSVLSPDESVSVRNGSVQSTTQDFFDHINQAFAPDSVIIEVSSDMVVDHPVRILRTTQVDQPSLENTRISLKLRKNSELTVLIFDLGNGQYFRNHIENIEIEEGARLTLTYLRNNSTESVSVGRLEAKLHQNSYFKFIDFSLGSKLSRMTVDVKLSGAGGEVNLLGLSTLDEKNISDNQLNVEHLAPNCVSRQLYKGVLSDNARSIFAGRVFVEKGAIGTDSDQLSKNLLLSRGAEVDTKPQLEVYADDVKATHGAAVGRLNQDELFYLQSRGIPKSESVSMLAKAFIDDILFQVADADAQAYARSLADARFQKMKVEGLAHDV